MSHCEQIRPWLGAAVERESDPGAALETARHVRDCTSCRILLARERRLAWLLEAGLDDPIQVSEDFLQQVMERLPDTPPPRRKRHLKLVVPVLGLALLAVGAARLIPLIGLGGSGPAVPRLTGVETGDPTRWFEATGRLVGMLGVALESLGHGLFVSGPTLPALVPVLGLSLMAATVLAAGGAGALAYFVHRSRRG